MAREEDLAGNSAMLWECEVWILRPVAEQLPGDTSDIAPHIGHLEAIEVVITIYKIYTYISRAHLKGN